MKLNNVQRGLTLIELMIAMTLGLIVIAAIIGLVVSVLFSNNQNLNEIRLNQELRAVMTLMSRDIRRAGYNGSAAANFVTNPFSSEAGAASDTVLSISGGNTVYFSYDANDDGLLSNGEIHGYRLSGDTVQYCQGNSTFANCAANWQALSDPTVVDVTGLTFTESLVTEEPGTTAEKDIRQITIILSGQWVNDAAFARTITESVKLRNEHFSSW